MSGAPHLPYLVVSLYTLRQHWPGDVVVCAWPQSIELVRTIAKDQRLDVRSVAWPQTHFGRNSQFLSKVDLMCHKNVIGCDTALYLDADTIICGDVQPLLTMGSNALALTQFNDWTTWQGIIRRRLVRMIGKEPIDQHAVNRLLTESWPSVNGGVFACPRGLNALDVWRTWSESLRGIFICDETALHAIMVKYPHEPSVLCGGSFNCSPKYKPKTLRDEDVVIWHFHGDSNVRPNKSQRGVDLWYPVYQECVAQNIGGIADWKDSCGNKYLDQLETFVRTGHG